MQMHKTNSSIFKISLLLILGCCFFVSSAQQNPGLSLYAFHPSYANAASVGLNGASFVQVHYRNQWTQYQSTYDGSGNLGTQIASVGLGFEDLNAGVGLQYVNDLTPSGAGLQWLQTQWAYHLPVGLGTFSAGLNVGMVSKSYDGRTFRIREPNDPLAQELNGKLIAKTSVDLGIGAMYAKDSWQIGLQVHHLNSPSFAFSTAVEKVQLNPMVQLNAGAEFPIVEQVSLHPFTQIRYYQGQLIGDVGMRVMVAKMFWVGGNYRSDDAISGLFGFSVLKNQLDFGYAIDQTISSQTLKAPLSHELFIRFNLPNLSLKFRSTKDLPVNTPRFKIN
jgi:type IX secretion system PorP/SprF family membrane protein